MPQKKKNVKKVASKNNKPKPPSKNSINVKIGLEDMLKLTCASCAAEEKKKKPRRKKRQTQTKEITDNNVSYVDDYGRPISNEIINKSFSSSYMPQPFSRNSSVVGTSFNESSIIDKVTEKIKKLNTSNQSMNQSVNNTVLNQSTAAPAPPQLPRPPPSTIVPASPSVVPQSLNFNLSSPVRQVGLTPLQASSMAVNRVQQYALSSMRAALNSQEALARIFKGVSDEDQAEIKQKVHEIKGDSKLQALINLGAHGGAQAMKFKPYFKAMYKGSMLAKEAATVAWHYYQYID